MALAGVLAVVVAFTGITGPEAAPPLPVVLVHGYLGHAADFDPMAASLRADGRTVYAITLPGQENVANAQAVKKAVDAASAANGGSKVDVVGHSMGGLSTRHYLKALGGTTKVAHYVAMGSPQYGYQPACILPPSFGGQMCPSSSFLAALNAGDDTPGGVAYTTLRSTQDSENGNIDGGACFGTPIPGVPHADEGRSPAFTAAVREALADGCPGEFVSLPITG